MFGEKLFDGRSHGHAVGGGVEAAALRDPTLDGIGTGYPQPVVSWFGAIAGKDLVGHAVLQGHPSGIGVLADGLQGTEQACSAISSHDLRFAPGQGSRWLVQERINSYKQKGSKNPVIQGKC